MNWNNTPNDQRLRLWKNLRDELEGLNLEDQLSKVAYFFRDMPIGKSTINLEDINSWPSPWEILVYGEFCENSTSLLMFYTFNLLPNFNHRLDLYLIDDRRDTFMVLVIDNQYALNWELGTVSTFLDLANNVEILNIIYQTQIKTIL